MWLTALLTPEWEAQKAEAWDMKAKEAAPQADAREPGDASLMPHLSLCSESCLHHGAPEPRRCQWTHRWGQQPETDLENNRWGPKNYKRPDSFDRCLAVHRLSYASPLLVCRSTSTVGLPLESRISLAKILTIDILPNRGDVITFTSMTSKINASKREEWV